MADWKRLAKALILADGTIGARETDLIKKALLTDGRVSAEEAEFALDLRNSATSAVPEFHRFVLLMVKKAVLADGTISAAEVAWLQKFVVADGKIDAGERALLHELKAEANATALEFDALLKKYG